MKLENSTKKIMLIGFPIWGALALAIILLDVFGYKASSNVWEFMKWAPVWLVGLKGVNEIGFIGGNNGKAN